MLLEHTVRRIPISDTSGKTLDTRIQELCDLMSTAGHRLVSMAGVGDQLLLIFSKPA